MMQTANAIDVYRDWLGIDETERPLNHYQLLRLKPFEDDTSKYPQRYRKMTGHVRKVAASEYATEADRVIRELVMATLCLSDARRKRRYDRSLGRPEEGQLRRRTLEEVLLVRQALDAQSLAQARNFALAVGFELRDVLIQRRLVPPEVIMSAYAESVSLPYLEAADIPVDETLAERLPSSFARQHACVPLLVDDGQLLVASQTPLDPKVTEALQQHFGMPVSAVLCAPGTVKNLLSKHYADAVPAAKARVQAPAAPAPLAPLRQADNVIDLAGAAVSSSQGYSEIMMPQVSAISSLWADRPEGLDPYRDWLGIQQADRPLNHYQLLRLKPFEDDTSKYPQRYRKMTGHVRRVAAPEYATEADRVIRELVMATLCLSDARRKRKYDRLLGRPEEGHLRRRTLEEVLLVRQALDAQSLAQARNFALAVGFELRDVLIQRRLVPPEVIMSAYAESVSLPYLEAADIPVDETLAERLPSSFARQHACVPLLMDDAEVLVASQTPLDPKVAEALQQHFGMPVSTVLCAPSTVKNLLSKHYADAAPATKGRVQSPGVPAHQAPLRQADHAIKVPAETAADDYSGISERQPAASSPASIGTATPENFEAYRDWLGIDEPGRPLNHYQMLRVKLFEDDCSKFHQRYRRMTGHVRRVATPDLAKEADRVIRELVMALLCLSDANRKREYDIRLGRPETGELRRRTLEEALLARHAIGPEALAKAGEFALAVGFELRDALIQRRLAPPELIMSAYAESIGLPYLEAADIHVDESLAQMVPSLLARQTSCVPLMIDDDQLLMATPFPIDPRVAEELYQRLNMLVRPVLCAPQVVSDLLDRYYCHQGLAAVLPPQGTNASPDAEQPGGAPSKQAKLASAVRRAQAAAAALAGARAAGEQDLDAEAAAKAKPVTEPISAETLQLRVMFVMVAFALTVMTYEVVYAVHALLNAKPFSPLLFGIGWAVGAAAGGITWVLVRIFIK